jgi:hypothetical protein
LLRLSVVQFVLLALLLQLLQNFKLLLELHALSAHLSWWKRRESSNAGRSWWAISRCTCDHCWSLWAVPLHREVLKCILIISWHIFRDLRLILTEVGLLELIIDSLVEHVLLQLWLKLGVEVGWSVVLLKVWEHLLHVLIIQELLLLMELHLLLDAILA